MMQHIGLVATPRDEMTPEQQHIADLERRVANLETFLCQLANFRLHVAVAGKEGK